MRVLIRLLQIALPVVVLAVAGLAAYTMILNRPPVETQPLRIEPPGVRAHTVRLDDVQLSVRSEGTVRPKTESQLVPEIAGRLVSVSPSFAAGGFFEAGDVLVTIDPFDYQQAVVSARSQLAQARLRLAQEEAEADVALREWEKLGRGDPRELTLRKPQLEEARAAVAAAEANVERAQRDLARTEITAPYAGRVRRKNVDVGQFVTVGNPIATIYAVDAVEIRLPLPDEELAYLDLPLAYRGSRSRQTGPAVTLTTTFAGETHTWQGRVVRTESEIDPVTRMVHAIVEVPNPYGQGPDPRRPPLAVGMYLEAEIEGRVFSEVAVVPRAALRGRNQVLVIDEESRIRFREVEILRSTPEAVFVSGGLVDGQRLATSSLDSPTEGMLVQVNGDTDERMTGGVSPVAQTAGNARSPRVPSAASRGAEVSATPPAPPAPFDTARNRRPPVASAAHAVAVEPFANISQHPPDAEFGSAVTREITERLAKSDTLTVVASADTATWVVGGGIQRVGDAMRVTARVLDGTDGAVVRTVKVDGTIRDLPGLQQAVATALAEALHEALQSSGSAQNAPPTGSSSVHTHQVS